MDVNDDGLSDIATGWEEGGKVRVYLHPGPAKVKEAWPAVTVGQVRSPEDAVFVDLDGGRRHRRRQFLRRQNSNGMDPLVPLPVCMSS